MRGHALQPRERVCAWCTKPYLARFNSQTVYCGHECARQAHVAAKRTNRARALQAQNIPCPVCAKQFRPRTRNQIHCAPACGKEQYKRDHREKVLDATKALRNRKKLGGNYLEALKRDDAKCARCGTPSILVHHIDNRGEKCTILPQNHVVTNLQVLCPACHHALHKLDWAIDDEGTLVIASEAFKPLLGTAMIRVPRKVVMPHDS